MRNDTIFFAPVMYLLILIHAVPVNAQPLKILALGDSYTIGQGVDEHDRWPNQLKRELQKLGVPVDPVTIAARSGWTTHDLLSALQREEVPRSYDLVLLLIGVNDQFQKRPIESFQQDFTELLKKAVSYAGDNPAKVIVISIPDWGASPYGRDMKQQVISTDIDRFNGLEKITAESLGVSWVNITDRSRETTEPSLYTQDGLHPSAAMYKTWVDIILPTASTIINKKEKTE